MYLLYPMKKQATWSLIEINRAHSSPNPQFLIANSDFTNCDVIQENITPVSGKGLLYYRIQYIF
jgi:hypothetical protein